MKLIYNTNDKPKIGKLIVFALQQVLAIITATIVVPVIINNTMGLEGDAAMDPAAALLGAGVGTLVYIFITKGKSPVFLGSSFAFLTSMQTVFSTAFAMAGAAAFSLGYVGLIAGAILAGLVYVILAVIVKFAGTGWINKLMPAVVIGPTVAIIGLSLAGNAVGDLQKSAYSVENDNLASWVANYYYDDEINDLVANYHFDNDDVNYITTQLKIDLETKKSELSNNYTEELKNEIDNLERIINNHNKAEENIINNYGSLEGGKARLNELNANRNINIIICILCGLVTLGVTIVCSTFGKKMMKLIPFICGIGAGYGLGVVLTLIGNFANVDVLKVIDFTPLTNLVTNFGVDSFFRVPNFTIVKAFGVFGNGIDESSNFFAFLLSVAVAYVPVAFVVFAEHIADHKNISTIINKDLLKEPGLHRTLLGDGVGSMAGALLGGCPNTTYGESVACVAITKNASVVTIFTAACIAIVIAFLSPFVALVNTIPSFVMGGVCMALYGFIAVSGLKMIQKVDLGANKNLFVVSTILIAGIGGLSLSFVLPIGTIKITSIACALILGILINLILSKAKDTEDEEVDNQVTE